MSFTQLRYNPLEMMLNGLIIRSQLLPPRRRKGVLRRPRLESRLLAVLDYPLTIVHAATGYGKSTSLAALAKVVDRLAWYTITEPDRDPLLFLAHLICSFERIRPAWCQPALHALEESGGRVTPAALTPLINTLTAELDGEAVLVLDDYHLVAMCRDRRPDARRRPGAAAAACHPVQLPGAAAGRSPAGRSKGKCCSSPCRAGLYYR